MRRGSFIIALVGVWLLPGVSSSQDIEGFEAHTFQGAKLTLPYRLFRVANPEAGKTYPLILFLHGAGERGDDNAAQLTANAGATVWATPAHQAAHPAYVVAPQCPLDQQWVDTDWTQGSYSVDDVPVSDELTTALEIADAVAAQFPIDPRRLYITGLSMGGYGTWDSIIRNPDRFAAAIAICGAGDPSHATAIEHLPIWTAHGDADAVVPVAGSRDMVTALTALGSTIQYSEYPGVGHDSWTQTYANEAVIDWLFEQEHLALPGSSGSGGSGGSGGDSSGGGGSAGTPSDGAAGSVGGAPITSAGSAGAPSPGGSGASGMAGGTRTRSQPDSGDDGGCSVQGTARGASEWLSAMLAGAYLAFLVARRRGTAP